MQTDNLTDLIFESAEAAPVTEDQSEEEVRLDGDAEEIAETPDTDATDEEPTDDGEEEPTDELAGPEDPAEEDIITLVVDGEETDVPMSDLIEAYQIEGAAKKRLQEATLARNKAIEEGRAEGMAQAKLELDAQRTELDQSRSQLSELLGHVGPMLFAPQVQKPDPALRQQDPLTYTMAMDDFRADQERIQGLQQQIVGLTQQQREFQAAEQQRVMRENRQQLVAKRPELNESKEAQQAFTANVRRAQEAVGFTTEEVNAYPDHRGLLLLDMLGKLLAEKEAGGPTPAQKVVRKAKKPLSPGAATYRRNKAKQVRDADVKQARQSGSVKDVARTLIVDGG